MKGIIITEEHGGRFGNKMLHYNNAGQLAQHYGCEVYIINGEISKVFNVNLITEDIRRNFNNLSKINTDIHNILNIGLDKIKNMYEYIHLTPCLGKDFFELNYDTRKIFSIKENIDIKKENGGTIIAIHFRGTDFANWIPYSILDVNYYLKSIEYCIDNYTNSKFILYTDDRNMNSFKTTIEYLTSKKIDFDMGKINSPFIVDFVEMSNSDVIISSPSTFCICAGFIKNKKDIIHSEKWINKRISENDKFWIDLNNGGNENYKLKALF